MTHFFFYYTMIHSSLVCSKKKVTLSDGICELIQGSRLKIIMFPTSDPVMVSSGVRVVKFPTLTLL
jgi:hypothetical protein